MASTQMPDGITSFVYATHSRSQNLLSLMFGALITTDKYKNSSLTAFFPSFNITLLFHLWLSIQSLITNKHSVNAAIIASSPRLDYLWHPGFTIAATGERRSEGVVSVCYERLSGLCPPARSIWSAVCVCAHVYVCICTCALACF